MFTLPVADKTGAVRPYSSEEIRFFLKWPFRECASVDLSSQTIYICESLSGKDLLED